MKRGLITTLGILNITGFCLLGVLSYSALLRIIHPSGATFRFGDMWIAERWLLLPIPIGALAGLASGALTLIKTSWRWGVDGLVIVGLIIAEVLFLFFLPWIL